MTPRLLILLGIGTVALLPLLSVPAEPGGGIQQRSPPAPLAPQIRTNLTEAQTELKNAVKVLGKTRTDMAAALKKHHAHGTNAKAQVAAALKLAQEPGAANAQKVEAMRKSLEGAMKELEAQDRMGNFEIQRLMSAFNQAETLSSNVQKKLDDTISGQQQKIGREGADDACCG